MEISSALLLLLPLLHIIAFISYTILIKFKRGPQKNPPPGPNPWPVIGNLNLIVSAPRQSLQSLSQKYGEIMQLKFGKFPVVIASTPEMAKQFLRTHDTSFASRPAFASGKYTCYNYKNMAWAPFGPYWRQARKIYHSEVFSPKRLDSFEHIRVGERRRFLSRLRSLCGKSVLLKDHLARHTLSSISKTVLGDRYFAESEKQCDNKPVMEMDELAGMLNELLLLNGAFNIGDWIPWLDFLDLHGLIKKMKALHMKLDRFHNYVIDDHQARRRSRSDADKDPKDVLDVLLQLAEDPNLEVQLTRDDVKALLQDLLTGGTDTSATTVEWAIHELLKQPRVIEKAREELDRVIGRERWVEESDFSQLPYIDAILIESMRLHPLSTFLAPHYAIEDCKVAGFDISKGTTVLINTWSIGRDPQSWDAPQEFLPERFMGKEVDFMGGNFALLPFGSGRRRCPGYNLGLKIVRATLANLVHGFEMRLGEGVRAEDVGLEDMDRFDTRPKEAISVIMEPRLPDHLY